MHRKVKPRRHLSPRTGRGILPELSEPRTLLSTLVVNGTEDNDTITLGATTAGGVKVIVNGSEKDYAPGQWTAVQVNSGTGNDTINVQATVVPTAIGGEGSGTMNVGDAKGVQDIKAALRVDGFPMGTDINVDDTGDATARTVSITATPPTAQIVPKIETISGLAPADITFTSNPPLLVGAASDAIPLIENPALRLTTGSGDDTVDVRSTLVVLLPLAIPLPFVASLTLDSSGGADTVNVGDAGHTNEVHGNLLVRNGEGHTTLNVDDSADTSPSSVTLSVGDDAGHPSGTINGLTAGSVTFRASDVSAVNLDGGSGGNTFTVNNTPTNTASTPGGPTITLNTGAANDQVTVDATAAGTQLNVDGGAGNDTLTVPAFATAINGDIAFDGGIGSNTLVVSQPPLPPGSLGPIPLITVTPGLISHGGHTLSYTDVQTLHLDNAAFQVKGDLGPLDLVVGQTPVVVAGPKTGPGPSFVAGPTTVELDTSQNLHALDILDGTVTLSSGGNKVLNTDSLSLGFGVLDLTNNSMQVHYGPADPFATIRQLIFNHHIRTSVAGEYENLGYADSADHVVKGLADNTVLVKFALDGDTDLDGSVTFADLVRLVRHYGLTGANWDQGDFNYDSKVFFDDFVLLARNYGKGLPT